MYPYQNHRLVHSVQQLDQPVDLAHLLPQFQHLQSDSRAGQSSSFNSLATALIPTTPLSHSLSQQQQEARLTHQQPQLQQQVLDHGHHANQFISQSFRHTGHQHAYHAQQGTRNVSELEMPLDGWSVSGPGPEPGFDQQFQHDAHGHGQSTAVMGMVYHNPKPTYPMHAHAQIMHDAASASDIDTHTAYAQSLTSNSSSLSDSVFDYSQGRGEPRAVSASVSDSSGSTGLGMDTSAIVIAEERWPDPHGLLPLSVDVGSALETGMVNGGEEIQFGTSYNTGMGAGMDGMDGMGGLGNLDLSMAYNMGYLGSGYGVDSAFGMSVASGHVNQGLQTQMQIEFGTGAEYGASYGASNYEGSASAGQDGWVPVQPEDAMHLQQLQRPLSASSSVGSGSIPGSSSSLAHANTYVPSSTLASGPPQGHGQEHGAECDNNSTYHSHGVQGISLQQQQQQHEVAVQISSNSNPSLVQAPQQQVAPAGFSSQQLQQQSQVTQSRVPSQPQPQVIEQQQQPQPRPRETPKLLPGQSGMLPPPDIPVRRKIGRPPMAGGRGGQSAKSGKSAKSGHVRGSGVRLLFIL